MANFGMALGMGSGLSSPQAQRDAPAPVISAPGGAFVGAVLQSTQGAQWAINGVPVEGERRTTFEIPVTAEPGDLITQGASNAIEVTEAP